MVFTKRRSIVFAGSSSVSDADLLSQFVKYCLVMVDITFSYVSVERTGNGCRYYSARVTMSYQKHEGIGTCSSEFTCHFVTPLVNLTYTILRL